MGGGGGRGQRLALRTADERRGGAMVSFENG